jgi:hypothetical protein
LPRIPGTKGRLLTLVAVAAVAGMLLPGIAAADGPWIEVLEPSDGGYVTDPMLEVRGNATPISKVLPIGASYLANGTGFGMDWDGENLTMSPREIFSDQFEGTSLDTDKWTIVRDAGDLSVEGGLLKLASPQMSGDYPLVQSIDGLFPSDMDWEARCSMRFATIGFSGSGGGISSLDAVATSSHMAAYNLWTTWPNPRFKIYADGEPVYNTSATDTVGHIYQLGHDHKMKTYAVSWDDTELATFQSSTVPQHFWFGSSTLGVWWQYANIEIDYVDIWAFNGFRTFEPMEMDHWSVIDSIDMFKSTSHPSQLTLLLEARTSPDNTTWSNWTEVKGGEPEERLEGKWLQLRVDLSLHGIRNPRAYIKITGFEVGYNNPIARVEARTVDGQWVDATGLESWTAKVQLEEDMNTVEVRVTDTAGDANVTSFKQILDTTKPVGNVTILQDRPYTNNLNVTLEVNATDRYGVSFVQVSSSHDFFKYVTFPYARTLNWRLGGTDGEVAVFVRFVDAHGLVSEPVTDTIIYDSFPPTGQITIQKGIKYTPSLRVELWLSHSDTRGVARVEVSNQANFTDVQVVDIEQEVIENWTLTEGGDGPRTVFMRLTDLAGNVRIVNDTIEFYEPKAFGGLTIEDGANLTKKTIVEIEVDVPLELHPRLMQLSNDAAFMNASWESVEKDLFFVLSPGDGYKVVYLRFLDFRDIVSLPVNTSIVLDTTPPDLELLIDGGSMYTTDPEVDLEIVYDDAHPAVKMWLSPRDRFNDVDPQDFSPLLSWTVPDREGDYFVYVKVQDLAGNEGVTSSAIHFATYSPEIVVSLPGGRFSASNDTVPINVTYVDPYGDVMVQISLGDEPGADAPWWPVEGELEATVPEGTGDGEHPIHVRARNAAGLVSDVVNVTVYLDRTPPTLEVLRPLDGSAIGQKGLDVLLEYMVTDVSGIGLIRYRVDGGAWTDIPVRNRSTVVSLDDFGDHTIEVMVADGVGNEASASTSFELVDSETRVGGGSSLLVLLLVVVIAIVLGIWYLRFHRRGEVTNLHPVPKDEVGATGPVEEKAPQDTGEVSEATAEPTPMDQAETPSTDEADEWQEF